MIEPITPVWDNIEMAMRELSTAAPMGLRPVLLQAADRIAQLEAALRSVLDAYYCRKDAGWFANHMAAAQLVLDKSPTSETACEHDYSGRCNNTDGSEQIFCSKCGRNP